MGSSGSKACTGRVSSLPSSSSGGRKGKRRRNRVFHSSCLGGSSETRDSDNDDDNVCGHVSKEKGGNVSTVQIGNDSGQVKVECYRKVKVEESEGNCVSSNVVLDEWNQASITNTVSRTGSSSARALSTSASTSQSSFFSRFNFLPGNMSFRLSRTASLGSSRAYGIPSSSPQIQNDEEVHFPTISSNNIIDGNETQQTSHLLPTGQTQNHESTSASSQHHSLAPDSLDNNQDNRAITSSHSGDGNGSSTKVGLDGTSHSPSMHTDSDSFEARVPDRRNGAQETVERNVCFSRTLSVGRLRDRVLRRSSVSDATFCPLQQERQVRDSLQDSGTETLTSEMRILESEQLGLLSPTTSGYAPGTSSSMSVHNHELETARARDTRYHDLLEHRSNFLERRRRIRSQVRALQRLGSRFENLSGHERSCILSGHHRAGRCTCRLTNRDANLNDDTSARASISRIVMLAEALFEQSVVLSSQPSISALGSVPAPNEIVESLPVKLYTKPQKHQNEEAAQCYICLVEYEEGDSMRVLPCHHEFHRTCIDKWLKEIHRVCPLCRGDICRSGSLPAEN
ncbi:E3 ubiquitin-protein ligase MBR1 isoform X2 [Euphorbia lathyris]|uniref:E3 ubiquitin-protein ligase MBR1 isoform X2 n=1 Tax=Euphorbia lathyris TaxID=212925 RepID=UPI003313679D